MELKELGLRIAKIRTAKKISAYELSLRIDKAPNYMHKMELGKINVSFKTLMTICQALEINPKDLF